MFWDPHPVGTTMLTRQKAKLGNSQYLCQVDIFREIRANAIIIKGSSAYFDSTEHFEETQKKGGTIIHCHYHTI